MAARKTEIPDHVVKELLRLKLEEGWSDQRLSELLAERWGIKFSRPAVQRYLARLMAPKPPVKDRIETLPEPRKDITNEQRLEEVAALLHQRAQIANVKNDTSGLAKTAAALAQVAKAQVLIREAGKPQDSTSNASVAAAAPLSQEEIDRLAAEMN